MKKARSAAKIRKDLEPLLWHRWSDTALAEQVERALGELEASGFVTFLRGKIKKIRTQGLPTPDGRRQALAFLGIDELKPKTTWSTLRKIHLPAQVLGLSASTDASIKAIASDPGFKAILLKQQFHLPAAELPKLDDILDALAWKLIGFEGSAQKFALKAVKTALFNRALGDGRATDFKKAANQLLAKRLGARRDDSKELRDASRARLDRPALRGGIRRLLMHTKSCDVLTAVATSRARFAAPSRNASKLPPALVRPGGMGATRFSSRMSGWRFSRTPCFKT